MSVSELVWSRVRRISPRHFWGYLPFIDSWESFRDLSPTRTWGNKYVALGHHREFSLALPKWLHEDSWLCLSSPHFPRVPCQSIKSTDQGSHSSGVLRGHSTLRSNQRTGKQLPAALGTTNHCPPGSLGYNSDLILSQSQVSYPSHNTPPTHTHSSPLSSAHTPQLAEIWSLARGWLGETCTFKSDTQIVDEKECKS